MAQNFGSGLNQGINTMSRFFNADDAMRNRDLMSQARAALMNQQAQTVSARRDEMPQEMALREKSLDSRNLMHALQAQLIKAKINALQNGGAGGAVTNKQGAVVQDQLDDGTTGTFQRPNLKTSSALQRVQISMPALAQSMDEITQGVKYYVSAGGSLQKILSSITAYATGNATPDQEKVLAQSRISKNAITQAAESMLGVLQLNPTEHNLKTTMEMFTPRQGETPEAFYAGLKQTFSDMKRRSVIADYVAQKGVPLDDNAKSDMSKYVKKQMNTDLFNTSFEGSGLSESTSGSSGESAPSEDQIQAAMKKYNLSREEAIQALEGK